MHGETRSGSTGFVVDVMGIIRWHRFRLGWATGLEQLDPVVVSLVMISLPPLTCFTRPMLCRISLQITGGGVVGRNFTIT